MIRLKALAAAAAFLALAGVAVILFGQSGTPMAGVPFPAFSLPRFAKAAPEFTSGDFGRDVVVVNFFSSWCGPCRAEHPLLMELKGTAPIVGINYMDDPAKARAFLKKFGNPYRDIAVDQKGAMELVLGVDSVPRTLVVAGGRIVYAHSGVLKREEIEGHLMPLLKQYQKRSGFRVI